MQTAAYARNRPIAAIFVGRSEAAGPFPRGCLATHYRLGPPPARGVGSRGQTQEEGARSCGPGVGRAFGPGAEVDRDWRHRASLDDGGGWWRLARAPE